VSEEVFNEQLGPELLNLAQLLKEIGFSGDHSATTFRSRLELFIKLVLSADLANSPAFKTRLQTPTTPFDSQKAHLFILESVVQILVQHYQPFTFNPVALNTVFIPFRESTSTHSLLEVFPSVFEVLRKKSEVLRLPSSQIVCAFSF